MALFPSDQLSTWLRLGGACLAAGCLAWLTAWLLANVRITPGAARHLRSFRDLPPAGQPAAELGERLAARLPVSLAAWQLDLAWARRGGFYPQQAIGNIVFFSLLYALGGLLVFMLRPLPVLALLPVLAAAFPWIRLRARANRVRRRAVRALPDVAVIVAAELAAQTTPAEAVHRAALLPGPLSGLLAEAEQLSRQTGRPLFSHSAVDGALVEVFSDSHLPQLRAFALQLDEVARKGVDAALLMNDAARGLALEYRERVMMEKEQLDGRLTRHVAFHFFMPAVILILAAFFLPMIALLSP